MPELKPIPTPESIRKDITGLKIGDYEILGFSRWGPKRDGRTYWVAKCKCGTIWEITRSNIHKVNRCDKCGRLRTRKPDWHKNLRKIYRELKSVCGDRFCKKWESFRGFLEDIGEDYPHEKHPHVPREGEINKDNITWESRKQHHRNGGKYKLNGKFMTLQEMADIAGVTRERIRQRINARGLSEEVLKPSEFWINRAKEEQQNRCGMIRECKRVEEQKKYAEKSRNQGRFQELVDCIESKEVVYLVFSNKTVQYQIDRLRRHFGISRFHSRKLYDSNGECHVLIKASKIEEKSK